MRLLVFLTLSQYILGASIEYGLEDMRLGPDAFPTVLLIVICVVVGPASVSEIVRDVN